MIISLASIVVVAVAVVCTFELFSSAGPSCPKAVISIRNQHDCDNNDSDSDDNKITISSS